MTLPLVSNSATCEGRGYHRIRRTDCRNICIDCKTTVTLEEMPRNVAAELRAEGLGEYVSGPEAA
jgi:hypothetical protein